MHERDESQYFLVGLKLPGDNQDIIEDSMKELEGLVQTAGGKVAGSIIQNRKSIDASYYIGKGKLEEIDILFDRREGDAIVFNAVLSPSQVRNIEELLECRVITRTELILDIFVLHARSRTAKLQVETAQLSYLLPRLTGQGKSMSRTGGGIGTRGPGETKLETDRRKINNRIALLRRELKSLEKASAERRKSRQDVFKVAVAGYTNAGKSLLTSLLVNSGLYSENKLFSTIDTTTRKMALRGVNVVITDTVGFIRDIPHELVESFRTTLAETVYANLIMHVVDVSSPLFHEKIETAEALLTDLDVSSEIILVFNKSDLISEELLLKVKHEYSGAFFVSAKDRVGLDELKEYIKDRALEFLKERGETVLYL
ncbi:MAG: GTPase HflX [Brevinemataceae bacterium]